jgi:hypothetical protein
MGRLLQPATYVAQAQALTLYGFGGVGGGKGDTCCKI